MLEKVEQKFVPSLYIIHIMADIVEMENLLVSHLDEGIQLHECSQLPEESVDQVGDWLRGRKHHAAGLV